MAYYNWLTPEENEKYATVVEKTIMREENKSAIEQQAVSALTTNKTFLATTSPTNAQTLAQVKALTRQMNGVIRLLLNQLDEV